MEGKNNTPSWVPHIAGMLMTVAATWATIQTQVREVVREEVHLQLAAVAPVISNSMDSLFTTYATKADTMLAERIKAQTDAVTDRIGLIPVAKADGTRVYEPKVIVHSDTALYNRFAAMLDSIGNAHRRTRDDLQRMGDPPDDHKPRNTRTGRQRWN